MLYIGFFKRIIPFVLTFAFGLLIASFFVPILPPFGARNGGNDRQKLIREIDRLNQEVQNLKEENENLRRSSWEGDRFELRVPAPPVYEEHHPPPPPPKRPKDPRRTSILQ